MAIFDILKTAPPGGVLLAAAMTMGAAIALGIVYGFVLAYLPFVHIATLAAAPALGAIIAQVANHGFQLGRVRHTATGMTVVTFAAAIGFYAAWVAWIAAVDGGDCTYLAKRLPVTAAEVQRIHEAAHQAQMLRSESIVGGHAEQTVDGTRMPW